MLGAPSAENMSQGRRVRYKHTIFYDTVSAVMLLVGTQSLRSQHPPLAAPPPGSAKTSPPLAGSKPPGEEGREERSSRKEATLSGSAAAAAGERRTRLFCRRNREGTNSVKRYAGVPSLSALLNPPTLRPSPSQTLSHAGPHQLCARLLLWLFFFTFIYYLFLLHAENDSDLHTAEHITF